jgi:hypothetical protein
MALRQEIVDLLRILLSDDGGRAGHLAAFEAQMRAINATAPVKHSEFMYIFSELKEKLALPTPPVTRQPCFTLCPLQTHLPEPRGVTETNRTHKVTRELPKKSASPEARRPLLRQRPGQL